MTAVTSRAPHPFDQEASTTGTPAAGLGLLLARLTVGGIFLLAAVPKIAAPGAFADAVRAYHLLPAPLVLPFAFALPWLELLVAVYLLVGFLTRIGAAGAVLLLFTFITALSSALLTGNTAHPCGCFGAGTNPVVALLAGGDSIGWWDVIRDVILLALSCVVLISGPGRVSVDCLLGHVTGINPFGKDL